MNPTGFIMDLLFDNKRVIQDHRTSSTMQAEGDKENSIDFENDDGFVELNDTADDERPPEDPTYEARAVSYIPPGPWETAYQSSRVAAANIGKAMTNFACSVAHSGIHEAAIATATAAAGTVVHGYQEMKDEYRRLKGLPPCPRNKPKRDYQEGYDAEWDRVHQLRSLENSMESQPESQPASDSDDIDASLEELAERGERRRSFNDRGGAVARGRNPTRRHTTSSAAKGFTFQGKPLSIEEDGDPYRGALDEDESSTISERFGIYQDGSVPGQGRERLNKSIETRDKKRRTLVKNIAVRPNLQTGRLIDIGEAKLLGGPEARAAHLVQAMAESAPSHSTASDTGEESSYDDGFDIAKIYGSASK